MRTVYRVLSFHKGEQCRFLSREMAQDVADRYNRDTAMRSNGFHSVAPINDLTAADVKLRNKLQSKCGGVTVENGHIVRILAK